MLIVLLIYLIGVVIHLLMITPESIELTIKMIKAENPDFVDDGWRPSNKEIIGSALSWPIITISMLLKKIFNK